jgi:hypothetical protein
MDQLLLAQSITAGYATISQPELKLMVGWGTTTSSPVFRSESTRGAVSVTFRDGPERIADPRWFAVDNRARACESLHHSKREACQSE